MASRMSPVNWSGGGRSWPVTSPPRPPRAPRAPAAMPNRTQPRRVMPFSFSSSSQLIETTSSERSRQDDFRPANLVNQLVRHELFAIDVDRDREEEEHHPHEDGHVGVRLGVREAVPVWYREDDCRAAEPDDLDDEHADVQCAARDT